MYCQIVQTVSSWRETSLKLPHYRLSFHIFFSFPPPHPQPTQGTVLICHWWHQFRLSNKFYLSWHGSAIYQCKQICLDDTSLTGYSSSCFSIRRVCTITNGEYVGILFMSHGGLLDIHKTILIWDRTSQQAIWWSHRRCHMNHVILKQKPANPSSFLCFKWAKFWKVRSKKTKSGQQNFKKWGLEATVDYRCIVRLWINGQHWLF